MRSRADLRTHCFQWIRHPSHWPASQARIAVEKCVNTTREHSHEQSHSRAGVAAIDSGSRIAKLIAADHDVIISDASRLNAKLTQRTNSRNDIVAAVWIDNAGSSLRHCR